MEPRDLDLPTLASLAGSGTVRLLLERIAEAGYAGVLPSHGYVIQLLVEGEPTISDLASSLGITQQGASKQVADLERLGYVERVSEPGDQRVRRVRLTTDGRGVLHAGRRARADLEAQVVASVGPRTVASAKKALAALLELEGLSEHVRTRTVPTSQD
jgi:DNA-binding MarR family transcriptional regulator